MPENNKNKAVIGVDIGGSATKAVIYDGKGRFLKPIYKGDDPRPTASEIVKKLLRVNEINPDEIGKIAITGVGSASVEDDILGSEYIKKAEFQCIGAGGLYLSGLERAIVVSLGTGSALVYAEKGKKSVYLGGTGVGGGTLVGLSKIMLGTDSVKEVEALAENGDLRKVDLKVSDLTSMTLRPGFDDRLTASNFGKLEDGARREDIALGLINMLLEAAAMVAYFAANNYKTENIVLTGKLAVLKQAPVIFTLLSRIFNVNYVIPKNAEYGPAIGAAILD